MPRWASTSRTSPLDDEACPIRPAFGRPGRCPRAAPARRPEGAGRTPGTPRCGTPNRDQGRRALRWRAARTSGTRAVSSQRPLYRLRGPSARQGVSAARIRRHRGNVPRGHRRFQDERRGDSLHRRRDDRPLQPSSRSAVWLRYAPRVPNRLARSRPEPIARSTVLVLTWQRLAYVGGGEEAFGHPGHRPMSSPRSTAPVGNCHARAPRLEPHAVLPRDAAPSLMRAAPRAGAPRLLRRSAPTRAPRGAGDGRSAADAGARVVRAAPGPSGFSSGAAGGLALGDHPGQDSIRGRCLSGWADRDPHRCASALTSACPV